METKIFVRREDFAKVVAEFVREGLNFEASPSTANADEYKITIKGF
jgi:hypothetical protein